MMRIAILAIAWVSTFFGGHALGSSTTYSGYQAFYYCAARIDSCQGSGWTIKEEFVGWCCCDLNSDTNWFLCSATIEVYINAPTNTLWCFKLLGVTESTTSCVPAPVADEPIQEVNNENCGCSLPQAIVDNFEISTHSIQGLGQ